VSWDDIPGWSGFLEIYDLAVDEAPQEGGVIVELGVAFGRSLAYLSRRVIDSGKKIKIYGVDPWWTIGGCFLISTRPTSEAARRGAASIRNGLATRVGRSRRF